MLEKEKQEKKEMLDKIR